jgi:hypothetical protein
MKNTNERANDDFITGIFEALAKAGEEANAGTAETPRTVKEIWDDVISN